MHGLVGIGLVVSCCIALWLALPRAGEVIPLMRGETTQMTFMMCWIVLFVVGVAMTLELFAR